MRMKISTVSAKVESSGERQETWDKVDEERKFQTEVRNPSREGVIRSSHKVSCRRASSGL